MYFRSKKDVWTQIVFYGFILFMIFIYSFGSESYGLQLVTYDSPAGYITTGVLLGILIWFWIGTKYCVRKTEVEIVCGPLKWSIEKKDIIKITKEKSIHSAPALSIDRLSILYGNYKVINISPKNQEEFIRLVTIDNPSIKID